MENQELMIRVQDVKKQYRLGQIGGGTLRGDLQSWWARKRGKEDPNTQIGTDQRLVGTTFMALNGVSFTVNKGEAVGIIGSNGAGKSTLLKLLTHVTAPTSGDIDLYGRVASMLEVGTGFHPEMTGRENVYLNGAILGMTRAEIDAKMDQIIEFSEVGDFIDTPVKRYSSGMYVKLAFSVAAHLDSEIMIMDEVLAVGDMKFQKKCLTKMRQAAKQDGRTVLYVSHNMATIRDLCDRCIVLDKGKVVFDGDVDTGIAIYMSNNYSSERFLDFTDFRRPSWIERKSIRMRSVEFHVDTLEAVERSQPVEVEYIYDSTEDRDQIGIFFEVHDEFDVPVATACLYGMHIRKGRNRVTAKYDFSMLAAGTYSNVFTTFTLGDGGSFNTEDRTQGVQFKLINTLKQGEAVWQTAYFGSTHLPDAQLCKEELI